jgi:hypothetical protein
MAHCAALLAAALRDDPHQSQILNLRTGCPNLDSLSANCPAKMHDRAIRLSLCRKGAFLEIGCIRGLNLPTISPNNILFVGTKLRF